MAKNQLIEDVKQVMYELVCSVTRSVKDYAFVNNNDYSEDQFLFILDDGWKIVHDEGDFVVIEPLSDGEDKDKQDSSTKRGNVCSNKKLVEADLSSSEDESQSKIVYNNINSNCFPEPKQHLNCAKQGEEIDLIEKNCQEDNEDQEDDDEESIIGRDEIKSDDDHDSSEQDSNNHADGLNDDQDMVDEDVEDNNDSNNNNQEPDQSNNQHGSSDEREPTSEPCLSTFKHNSVCKDTSDSEMDENSQDDCSTNREIVSSINHGIKRPLYRVGLSKKQRVRNRLHAYLMVPEE